LTRIRPKQRSSNQFDQASIAQSTLTAAGVERQIGSSQPFGHQATAGLMVNRDRELSFRGVCDQLGRGVHGWAVLWAGRCLSWGRIVNYRLELSIR
jgi:hypothetical protein